MTVIAAYREVQTKEEATVYVRELDVFVTVKLLEDTAVVLSLGNSANTDISTSGPVVNYHIW